MSNPPIAHYNWYGVAMTQLTYVYEGTDYDTGLIVVTSTVEPEPGEELDPEKPRDYWIHKSPVVPKGLRPHVASSECPCNPRIDMLTKDNEVFWTLTHNEMRVPR